MPNLKAIRKRIVSVKNTRKITRAMKLVAAARLRRAQENIVRLRPYAQETMRMISALALRAGEEEHPLLARREPKKVMLVVLTSDRGLAGAFNTGIAKAAFRRYQELTAESTAVSCSRSRCWRRSRRSCAGDRARRRSSPSACSLEGRRDTT